MMAAAALVAASCSDFDDYNETPAESVAAASKTLWENINGNPKLSQFASLVKKAGYDEKLSSARTYSVWAPLNNSFDYSKWESADSAAVRFQFVENHIANYNRYISSPVSERVTTLNYKSYALEGSSAAATFGNIAIDSLNMPCSNGVLYTLNGEAVYRHSFYEYLTANKETDSLSRYIMRYEQSTLDEENSVPGPIVDGVQTWEDSVMIVSNDYLYGRGGINAYLISEDSSYVMLMPTNEAWDQSYKTLKQRFNYGSGKILSKRFYMDNTSVKEEEVTDEVGAAYLSDSLARRTLVSDLVFSTKNWYNRWLENVNPSFCDTLQSTNRSKFSNPQELLSHKTEEVLMSNGRGIVVDTLAFKPWEWYASSSSARSCSAYKYSKNPESHTITKLKSDLPPFDFCYPNLFKSGSIKYERIEPKLTTSEMSIYYDIKGLTAGTYSVYCIMLPPDADADHARYEPEPEMLPTVINSSIWMYNAKTSKTMELFFKPGERTPLTTGPKSTDVEGKNDPTQWAFVNDITKIDPVYLGDVTLDVSYYGLENGRLTVKIAVPRLHADYKESYSRTLRVARVMLVPVELSKSNQQ